MFKFKKVTLGLVVFVALGVIAKLYNESTHLKTAAEECNSQNISEHVDSKKFECVKPNAKNRKVVTNPSVKTLAEGSAETKPQSDRAYKLPIILESPKLRISIDQLDDDSYRYRSWNRGESMLAKPSLTLTMKEDSLIEERTNDVYTFRNGNYTYTVKVNRTTQDTYHPPILRVDQGKKNLLLKEISYRLSKASITFPWKELTETGYVAKFISDSVLTIDQPLYKKLQMEKIYSNDLAANIDKEVVSYLYKDNDIHHLELTINGSKRYFTFLATYTEDWKLIDYLQVGSGDPNNDFWYQDYTITAQKGSKLIVRSSYGSNNGKDVLTERDTFELHLDGTFSIQNEARHEYAGTYAFQFEEGGPRGTIYLYPSTDSSLLFHLYANRGAPSYNSGRITGQMHLTSKAAASFFINKPDYLNCDLRFSFKDDAITVHSEYPANKCGFGYAVKADGKYKRISKRVPQFFHNGEGTKVWFKNLNMSPAYGKTQLADAESTSIL